jgi:hypothetical protein
MLMGKSEKHVQNLGQETSTNVTIFLKTTIYAGRICVGICCEDLKNENLSKKVIHRYGATHQMDTKRTMYKHKISQYVFSRISAS